MSGKVRSTFTVSQGISIRNVEEQRLKSQVATVPLEGFRNAEDEVIN